MKRYFLLLLCMAIFFGGCGAQRGGEPQTTAAPTPAPEETPELFTAQPEAVCECDVDPVLKLNPYAQRQIDAMLPVLDAVARAMRESPAGYKGFYDPESLDYVWSVLYRLCINGSAGREGVTVQEDGAMGVPRALMRELATASFKTLLDVPKLPELGYIRYDETAQTYILDPSDASEEYMQLLSSAIAEDDAYAVRAGFFDGDGTPLETYVFKLGANENLVGVSNPVYTLCVWEAQREEK